MLDKYPWTSLGGSSLTTLGFRLQSIGLLTIASDRSRENGTGIRLNPHKFTSPQLRLKISDCFDVYRNKNVVNRKCFVILHASLDKFFGRGDDNLKMNWP